MSLAVASFSRVLQSARWGVASTTLSTVLSLNSVSQQRQGLLQRTLSMSANSVHMPTVGLRCPPQALTLQRCLAGVVCLVGNVQIGLAGVAGGLCCFPALQR